MDEDRMEAGEETVAEQESEWETELDSAQNSEQDSELNPEQETSNEKPEKASPEADAEELAHAEQDARAILSAERNIAELERLREETRRMLEPAAVRGFAERQAAQLQEAFPECGVNAQNIPEELGTLWARLGNLTDAYRVLHFEEISKNREEAARQKAFNEMRSKRQLDAGGQAAGQAGEVNEGDLRMLRKMMPGHPDRELRAMLLKVR